MFYLKSSSNKPDDPVKSIYIRLTVNRKREDFSVQRRCTKEEWNPQSHRMRGNKGKSREVNGWLEILNARAHECRQVLFASGKHYTAAHIRKLMQGEDLEPVKTLGDVWDYHVTNIAGLIGRG